MIRNKKHLEKYLCVTHHNQRFAENVTTLEIYLTNVTPPIAELRLLLSRLVHLDTTSVTFRQLTPEEIERYIEREKPFDCAGGFKVEALGITLFESIESRDPTALIGLPLIWLASALRSVGYSLP